MTVQPLGVLGAGWVGLVTAACFAELGHDVVVRDVVPERIAGLKEGRLPIYEPGLAELVAANRERLRFTVSAGEVFDRARIVFVCVGTPPTYSGDADLTAVHRVLDELPSDGQPLTLVMKSTVPVGTGAKVLAELAGRGVGGVAYVSNPEFLAESTAIHDFMRPDRVVVGAFGDEEGALVASLYAFADAPIVRTDVPTAEMIKYASNAFLATKISFINEIANVCDETGADVTVVAEGMGHDRRIGPHFLRAGLGYSGNCLDGRETVLVRYRGAVALIRLEHLFDEFGGDSEDGLVEPEGLEVLSWRPDAEGASFLPVSALTRRWYAGDMIEVRTTMGRRITVTPDHPFVVSDADGRRSVRLAAELESTDWLPLAQGFADAEPEDALTLDVLRDLASCNFDLARALVRPLRGGVELVQVGSMERAAPVRSSRVLELRDALAVASADSTSRPRRGFAPASIVADDRFWRVVGLYLAEGHCTIDRRDGTHRLQWCFHPTSGVDLVEEVLDFWRSADVHARIVRQETSTLASVSTRLIARWWLDVLGMGRNAYDQRVPDLIWTRPERAKRALLSGLWHGDGSWSYVNGWPSVALQYGTVSRELADGTLRLLADLGIVARLRVGRTAKSTTDMHWLTISGADQIERLPELVSPMAGEAIAVSHNRQSKRIAPTGYRKRAGAAWVRVVGKSEKAHADWVYSLEVPASETFVSTHSLVCHNCLPKDVAALKQLAGNSGYHFQLLTAVIEVNELQKRRVLGKLVKHLGPLRGKTVALLGLAFKPNTNDMREASSLVLAARLLAEGAIVRGWDPAALDEARALLTGVELHDDLLAALAGADAAIVVTEWDEVRRFPFERAREAMASAVLIDGRNVLDPVEARAHGFLYESIGRPSAGGA